MIFLFCLLQESAENITVFGVTIHTTCSVEAYNGVLGKNIRGQSTFFKFVEAIKFEADAKSLELKGYKDSGGELRSDRKKQNKVSYYLNQNFIFSLVSKIPFCS